MNGSKSIARFGRPTFGPSAAMRASLVLLASLALTASSAASTAASTAAGEVSHESIVPLQESSLGVVEKCGKGKGLNEKGNECVDCVPGSTFSNTRSKSACKPVTTKSCPAGHSLLPATKKSDGRCIKCQKGTERPEGSDTQSCTTLPGVKAILAGAHM